MRLPTVTACALLGLALVACSPEADEDTEGSEEAIATSGRPDTCTDPSMPDSALPCARSEGHRRTTIRPGLIDNRAFFQDDFFQRFQLKPAARPLDLTDSISKTYEFPTLYTDVTSSIGMFFCSLDRARALMPDPAMKPVDMGWGRGVVIFSSTRFNRIYGMEGYNEVVISIPVVVDRGFNPPALPLLMEDWRGLGFFVISVPVSSEENRVRGRIWGMPKVLQDIDLAVEGGEYVTRVKDDSGRVYLEYRVPTRGDAMDVDNENFVYSMLDGSLARSRQHAHGKYVKTTWPQTIAVPNLQPSRTFLTLGSSGAAAKLRDLEIAAHPFQVRFGRDTDSALELPDPSFRAR